MSPLSIVKKTLNRINERNKENNNPMKKISFCIILVKEKNFLPFMELIASSLVWNFYPV